MAHPHRCISTEDGSRGVGGGGPTYGGVLAGVAPGRTVPLVPSGFPSTKKRKRTQTNVERRQGMRNEEVARIERILNETRMMTKKVLSISEDLSARVIETPNTRIEIKRAIEDLAWAASRLDNRADKMTAPLMKLIRRNNRITVDTATQTRGGGELERTVQENRDATRIMDELSKGGGLEEFMKVAHLKWPQNCFTHAKIESKAIAEVSRDWDLATMVAEDFDMGEGENKKIRDQFQEIEALRGQEAGIGGGGSIPNGTCWHTG